MKLPAAMKPEGCLRYDGEVIPNFTKPRGWFGTGEDPWVTCTLCSASGDNYFKVLDERAFCFGCFAKVVAMLEAEEKVKGRDEVDPWRNQVCRVSGKNFFWADKPPPCPRCNLKAFA